MTQVVSIQLDGSFATYEVKHEIDGIYTATLQRKGFSIAHSFPEKVVLRKADGSWSSDYPNQEIGLKIGQKINEQENSSRFLAVKAESKPYDNQHPANAIVPCTILIIDDDNDDVAILSDAFTECGVDSIHYVFSAMQAFIYLQGVDSSSLPKLIITDHYLPGMTGAEFLNDLKGMEKYKHIHVIVLATTKSERELKKYREMGALDYLIKPTAYEDYVRVAADMKNRAGL